MLAEYLLQLADNTLILGHRLSEWCGKGPALEQDIALTNIALDLIGNARNTYQYAAETFADGRTEDDLAYLRDARAFKNVLLVEQPNRDFAYTIVRQFLFDSFHYYFQKKLCDSSDERLAGIAEKTLKETTYHLRWSSEWLIRLGDGTAESHQKAQRALNDMWQFTGELLMPSEIEKTLAHEGIAVDLAQIAAQIRQHRHDILTQATLTQPLDSWMQSGGKTGKHTEHLGYILAEMQFLQRAYPNAQW